MSGCPWRYLDNFKERILNNFLNNCIDIKLHMSLVLAKFRNSKKIIHFLPDINIYNINQYKILPHKFNYVCQLCPLPHPSFLFLLLCIFLALLMVQWAFGFIQLCFLIFYSIIFWFNYYFLLVSLYLFCGSLYNSF